MQKSILLLGAGIEQVLAIQQAKQLGLFVIACDNDPSAVGLSLADVSYVFDIRNEARLLKIAGEHKVDGVFAHAIEMPDIVAQITKKLGLPGLSYEVAERATNKYKRIAYLNGNNVPCAKFEVVKSQGELFLKAEKLGIPLIIKPVDASGARGVRLVRSIGELQEAYVETLEYSRFGVVLLEEVLDGPEISTESVVYNDKIYTFAIADRNYEDSDFYAPYFVENGINYSSVLSESLHAEIKQLVEKTIRVLGIKNSAAKGDIIIHNGKPKIIEMAARTSGGWFGAGSIAIATGVNMLKPLIQMAVGEQPDLTALQATRNLGCAQRYLIPSKEGIFRGISGTEEAKNSLGVKMCTIFPPKIGTRISKAKNHAERFAQVICVGDTRDIAISNCVNAINKMRIHYD
jgi:biotin carboxylase